MTQGVALKSRPQPVPTSRLCPSEGIIVALALPTDASNTLMKGAISTHLAWLRARGIQGVLALGSTGEFLRFTVDERKAILEFVAEMAAPLPVIANVSDMRPQVAAELGRFARRLGLPAIAVMPPSFYPVSDADQLAFFTYVAEESQLPVILYNFPELTGNRISPETIAAFADRAPIAGIKQSGKEFEYHKDLIALGEEKGFPVFSGADTRLPEAFGLGAAGCIGGLVNFLPEDMVSLFYMCRKNRPGAQRPLQTHLTEAGEWLNRLTFPLNVAAGMEARGLEAGHPKMIVSDSSRAAYGEIVAGLRASFQDWGLPLHVGRGHE